MFRMPLAPKAAAILLVALLIAVPRSGATPPAAETQIPLVHLSPGLLLVPIGGAACTDVEVQDVQDLFAFSTDITFDPGRVAVVDADPDSPGVQITVGPFLRPTGGNWYVINSVDNAGGLIRLAITLLPPETGRSGSGTLATVCFRGLNRGHSAVTFSESSTLLLNPQVSTIPFTAKSGGAFVGPIFRFRIPLVARGR